MNLVCRDEKIAGFLLFFSEHWNSSWHGDMFHPNEQTWRRIGGASNRSSSNFVRGDSPFTSGRAWQRQPGIHVRELIKPMHPRHFADSLTKLLAARIRLEALLLSTYDPCAELGPGLRCKRTFPSAALLSYRFITQIRLSSHRVHSSPLRSTLPTL